MHHWVLHFDVDIQIAARKNVDIFNMSTIASLNLVKIITSVPVGQDDESGLPFRKLVAQLVDGHVLVLVAVGDDDLAGGVDLEDEGAGLLAAVESERPQPLAKA
jgi:hypothetical protein